MGNQFKFLIKLLEMRFSIAAVIAVVAYADTITEEDIKAALALTEEEQAAIALLMLGWAVDCAAWSDGVYQDNVGSGWTKETDSATGIITYKDNTGAAITDWSGYSGYATGGCKDLFETVALAEAVEAYETAEAEKAAAAAAADDVNAEKDGG